MRSISSDAKSVVILGKRLWLQLFAQSCLLRRRSAGVVTKAVVVVVAVAVVVLLQAKTKAKPTRDVELIMFIIMVGWVDKKNNS
jgi:hypothetical protein